MDTWDIIVVIVTAVSLLWILWRWFYTIHLRQKCVKEKQLKYKGSELLPTWPVCKTVAKYFFGFLAVALLFIWIAVGRPSSLHVSLAGIGAWVLAFCVVVWLYFGLEFDFTAHAVGVCPRDLAIQEVDLLSTFCSVVAFIVSLSLFLRDAHKDSAIRTWEATTVWPYTGNATCNRSDWSAPHTCATAAVQEALGHSCKVANAAPELYVRTDTWNSTAYESFVVGTPSESRVPVIDWLYNALLHDQWYAVMWVLAVNALYQVERAFGNKAVSESSCPYDPEAPDSSRWTEYVLTSPVQVFLVAVSVGMRQGDVLWLLMACQALLILLGLLIETCVFLQTLPETSAASTAGVSRRFQSPLAPYRPVQAAPYMLVHAQDLRIGCPASPPSSPPAVFRLSWGYVFGLVGTGFWWHSMIWKVLIVAFVRAEQQFDDCHVEEVPPWIRWLLYVQLSLFTLFGVVQAWMVYAVRREQRSGREPDYRCTWQTGTLLYSVLSVTAKLALDVLFIAGTAARE